MMKVQVFKLNADQVCRTCFSMDSPLADVSSVSFNGESLVQLLQHHLSVNIITDDDLPKNICGNCICELHRIHTFFTKCRETQTKLESFFQKTTEPEKTTEDKQMQQVMQIKEEVSYSNENVLGIVTDNVQPDNKNEKESTDNVLRVKSLYEQLIDEIKSQNVKENIVESEIIEENEDDLIELNLSTNNDEIQEEVKRHEPKLVPEQGPPYICDCKISFSSVVDLKAHRMKFGHEKVPLFSCDICKDEKLYLYGEYKSHLIGHYRDKSYQCDKCDQTFSRFTALKIHRKTHLNYKCNVCDREFKTPAKLNYHSKFCSENKCKWCSELYPEKSLKTHIIKSCKNSPFVCNICQKRLSAKRNLVDHKRRIHQQ